MQAGDIVTVAEVAYVEKLEALQANLQEAIEIDALGDDSYVRNVLRPLVDECDAAEAQALDQNST